MTKEEAIYLLRNTAWLASSLEPVEEAVDMAIEALKERPKGKWIDEGDPLTLRCSKCDYRVARYNNTNYCPNCGADMRSKIAGKHADFMMIDEAVVKGEDDETD